MKRLTSADLQQKLKEGKIRGFSEITKPSKSKPKGKKLPTQKKCKERDMMHIWAWAWAKQKGLTYLKEAYFSDRMFRFDGLIPQIKYALEWQGLNSEKSGHTTFGGYARDIEKRNLAESLGYTVRYYMILNYKDVISDLEEYWARKQNEKNANS